MACGIIGQHGGTMAVESQEGQGSTFTVYLPRIDDLAWRPSFTEAMVQRQNASSQAARHQQGLAGHVLGVRRRQVYRGRRDIVRLPHASERCLRLDHLLEGHCR